MKLTFIEAPAFIKQIDKLGRPKSVDVLTAIQDDLLKDPERGDVIKATNGARKGRIGDPSKGKGKSGSFRYIYCYSKCMIGFICFIFTRRRHRTT